MWSFFLFILEHDRIAFVMNHKEVYIEVVDYIHFAHENIIGEFFLEVIDQIWICLYAIRA